MGRKPTMEDVATRAGVSRSLVSLVFQGSDRVSPTRRAAVLVAAEELCYRPNRTARTLARGRSSLIGVVVDDLANPYFARVVEGVEAQVSEAGFQMLVVNGGRDGDRFLAATTALVELGVDGVVAVAPRASVQEFVSFAGSTPVVVIGHHGGSDRLDTVNNDERHGSALVIDHLVNLGHRDIVHVDGGAGAGAHYRRQGYLQAMNRAGLGVHARIITGEFTVEAGHRAVAELLTDTLPTAVFTANDLIATGVWAEFAQAGVSVPTQVSLVGYDDSSLLGLDQVGLTSVHQPAAQFGDRAAALVLERVDGLRNDALHTLLTPRLVVRTSTAPPRGKK